MTKRELLAVLEVIGYEDDVVICMDTHDDWSNVLGVRTSGESIAIIFGGNASDKDKHLSPS